MQVDTEAVGDDVVEDEEPDGSDTSLVTFSSDRSDPATRWTPGPRLDVTRSRNV